MIRMILLIPAIIWLAAATAVAAGGPLAGERVYIVNDYRYAPGATGENPEQGHAVCAVRCNALSVDYRNYIEPGGWRFIKVASDRELTIEPGNPFILGHCVCTVDEYVVQLNTFNRPTAAGSR